MRVAFLGNWALGWAALAGLVTMEPAVDIVGIWTNDDPGNRVLEVARRLALPLRAHKGMRDGSIGAAALQEVGADVAVMANFNRILGAEALSAPRLGVINLHPSLLPRHRGPAPVRWTILRGDARAGVTAIRADSGVDTGEVITAVAFPVTSDDDYTLVITRLAACMPEVARRIIELARADRLVGTPQDERFATQAPRLEEQDWRLRWDRPSQELSALVRAGFPPGAWFHRGDRVVRVRKAEIVRADGASAPPGTVLEGGDRPLVATADGALRLVVWDGATLHLHEIID